VRVVAGPDGELSAGRTAAGRGAWLCAGSAVCLAQAARRDAFARALRRPTAPGAAERLASALGWGGAAGPPGVEERRA